MIGRFACIDFIRRRCPSAFDIGAVLQLKTSVEIRDECVGWNK